MSKSKFPVVLTVVNAAGNMSDYSAAELRALAKAQAKGKGKVETYWISARDEGGVSLAFRAALQAFTADKSDANRAAYEAAIVAANDAEARLFAAHGKYATFAGE